MNDIALYPKPKKEKGRDAIEKIVTISGEVLTANQFGDRKTMNKWYTTLQNKKMMK